MDPKLQSSFIPKGPGPSSVGTGLYTRRDNTGRTVVGIIAVLVFVVSLLAALGVFGYGHYLTSRIGSMGKALDEARTTINPELIHQITSLDNRIKGTRDILNKHTVLSPFFAYLESATLQTVGFTDFKYTRSNDKITLDMKGMARGYQAVALQSDVFNKSPYFKNPIFSDLHLDEKGNVIFTFAADVTPNLVSYQKFVQDAGLIKGATSTSVTASSTPKSASTTKTTAH